MSACDTVKGSKNVLNTLKLAQEVGAVVHVCTKHDDTGATGTRSDRLEPELGASQRGRVRQLPADDVDSLAIQK